MMVVIEQSESCHYSFQLKKKRNIFCREGREDGKRNVFLFPLFYLSHCFISWNEPIAIATVSAKNRYLGRVIESR